jgi:hypothetical protein
MKFDHCVCIRRVDQVQQWILDLEQDLAKLIQQQVKTMIIITRSLRL